MRHILVFIVACLCTQVGVYAQFSKEEKEILDIVQAQDSLPRNIFLDSTLLSQMRLVRTNTRQVWFSTNRIEKHIEQLFDIRLKFEDHNAALKFHQKYLNENSEFGPEIKKHKIKSAGAEEFKVFKGTSIVNKMVEAYGFQMYCYLFVVDNYFVKVYVCCNIDYKPEKFQHLITDIIARIKK